MMQVCLSIQFHLQVPISALLAKCKTIVLWKYQEDYFLQIIWGTEKKYVFEASSLITLFIHITVLLLLFALHREIFFRI